jgi:type III secretory pathway component EscS
MVYYCFNHIIAIFDSIAGRVMRRVFSMVVGMLISVKKAISGIRKETLGLGGKLSSLPRTFEGAI